MDFKNNKWSYLIFLSLIWGSSFILIKKALIGLTPVQLGALRVIFGGFFLFLIGFKNIKSIKKNQWKWIAWSGFLGTFFPAFLFAFAIKGIDSSVASILNSITPLNALWIGTIFFGFTFKSKQFLGIIIGAVGTILLIYQSTNFSADQNYLYALLPVIGSLGYAINVNIIKKHLQEVPPKAIAVGNFVFIFIPAIMVLCSTDFFNKTTYSSELWTSILYLVILALFGTALAKIFFNKLIHLSSAVFATSVTYLIPIVALVWGVIDGEKLNIMQCIAGIIILLGLWLVNKAK